MHKAGTMHPAAPVILVGLVLGIVGGCSGDDTTATTTTTEAPGELIDPATLAVGDCFEERVLPNQGATEVNENQTVKVACTDPHRNEVYLVTQMPGEPGAPFPGSDAITAFADQ